MVDAKHAKHVNHFKMKENTPFFDEVLESKMLLSICIKIEITSAYLNQKNDCYVASKCYAADLATVQFSLYRHMTVLLTWVPRLHKR